jgi:flagellar hook-associated protein 1 FlgK
MSGLGVVLDLAKEALLAQKYAIDIVSHNIANVNTPGYTRQTASLLAKDAAPLAGLMLGRGVTIADVIQSSDSFIETRLRDQKTNLAAMSEMEIYMSALEGIFNENSGRSLSIQLSELWNAWQDLSNNPSGTSERSILFERGAMLAESFQALYSDLNRTLAEIGNVIETGVNKANILISNIAKLNEKIIQIEVSGNANDLRDQRNLALTQLAEYLDVKAYENEDGNLTVTTGRGYVLVSRSDPYLLRVEGEAIKWQGSGTTEVTITDMIAGGKLSGWLEMRDAYIPEYKANLNSLAEALVWQINTVHSRGVGLEGFSSVTGTYTSSDPAQGLGTAGSGLSYSHFIKDGSFKVWLYEEGQPPVEGAINIDADVTTLNSLVGDLNLISPGNLVASVSGGKLTITTASGFAFAFSSDTSNVLAALGVNTFLTGSGANTIAMNTLLNTNSSLIAAGKVNASGGISAGDNSNALVAANLQEQSVNIERWTYTRGSAAASRSERGTLEGYLHSLVSSIGIDSQSIRRSREFNEAIVQTLSTTRDNISAVSLDEEMTNLIKYQHAYAAAAKLISAADEMLKILLGTV